LGDQEEQAKAAEMLKSETKKVWSLARREVAYSSKNRVAVEIKQNIK
jgi:hypothetical protein